MLDQQRLLEWQTEREDSDRRNRRLELWVALIAAGVFTVIGAAIGAVLTAILTR